MYILNKEMMDKKEAVQIWLKYAPIRSDRPRALKGIGAEDLGVELLKYYQ